MKFRKYKKFGPYIMMTVFAALLLYMFCFSGIGDDLLMVQLKPSVADNLDKGWQREENDGKQAVFSNTLPEVTEKEIFLAFPNFARIWLSISVGCAGAAVRDGECDVEWLVKIADEKMYEDKVKEKRASVYRQ